LEQPDLLVDVATLTGAARVALGARYTGLIGTAKGVDQLLAAAQESGEDIWQMPLPKELRANLDSDVADLANAKVGSALGGMLVAGHFLKEFVGTQADGTPLEWAHLDIAGPADNEGSAYGFTPKGPTGVMLRTMVTLARQMSVN
jgi:leucyl aminopeptidase